MIPADSNNEDTNNNPFNFYSQAKECKFFKTWKPFSDFEGVEFYHSDGYMRFSYGGTEYLCGINPRGFLVGFASLSNPSQRADILLLDSNFAGGHPRAIAAAPNCEQKVTKMVLANIPPPPSGNLAFPPRG